MRSGACSRLRLRRFGRHNVGVGELVLEPGLALRRGVDKIRAPIASNNQIAKILDGLAWIKDNLVDVVFAATCRRKDR